MDETAEQLIQAGEVEPVITVGVYNTASLGGLVSLYLGLEHPGTFTRLGILSPTVWWANKAIVEKVKALDTRSLLRL